MDHRRLNRCVCLLVCGAVLLLWSDAARAQGRAKKPKTRKVSSWGELGKPIKGSDFYEITYYKKTGSGRKAKVKKTKAFLEVTSKSVIYRDARIGIGQLEPEQDVRIFGKPVSRQVPGGGGRGGGRGGGGAGGGVDSQIQNARVVLSGDVHNNLPFDKEFVDPKARGYKWLEAKVTKSGGGLWVTSLGTDNRVTMAKGAPILKRAKVKPARLKGRLYIQFFARTTSERPDTGRKSDAKKDSFRASMIVILDRGSLASVYPLMWKR